MRSDLTLEEYTNYRKQYIDEAKRSCYAQEMFGTCKESAPEQEASFSFEKVRLLVVMFLLIGFLYCRYTDTEIIGYSTDELISAVEEQQFTTADKWMARFADYLAQLK